MADTISGSSSDWGSDQDPDDGSDPSEQEFGQSGIALSTYRFPTGWFVVAFASD